MPVSRRLNRWGENAQSQESLAASVSTIATFAAKLNMAVPIVPIGTYRLDWSYGWNHDANTNDFEARILVDGAVLNPTSGFEWMLHKQEPKDSAGAGFPPASGSGTSQATRAAGHLILPFVAAAAHTLELQWRTDAAGVASTIWDARFTFLRMT